MVIVFFVYMPVNKCWSLTANWVARGSTVYSNKHHAVLGFLGGWDRSNFYHAKLCIARSLLSTDVSRLSVCLSVSHVGVFTVLCQNSKLLNLQPDFLSPGSPIILVFPQETLLWNSYEIKWRWGTKNLRFSTNISLYLGNDARYDHSYYETLIGNHRHRATSTAIYNAQR